MDGKVRYDVLVEDELLDAARAVVQASHGTAHRQLRLTIF